MHQAIRHPCQHILDIDQHHCRVYFWPERVIGMHFMNPVPIMKLVEVINGTHTTELVTSEVISVIEALGRPLQCNDSPGFVSNRILCPMINEAIITLDEGVAEARPSTES